MEGVPVPNSKIPPLSIQLRGHSNNDAFVAETLHVSVPGFEVQLSAPVAIDRNLRLHSAPSDFTLSADLAKQPWFPGTGRLQGTGRISGGRDDRALLDFLVQGNDITALDIAVSKIAGEGQLDWPTLKVQNGTIATPDGSELVWHGGLDLRNRDILDTAASGQVARALLARWLPEYPKFDTVQIEARVRGEWEAPTHDGHVEVVDFSMPRTHPLAVKLDWKGRGLAVETFSAEARAGETMLTAQGSADRSQLALSALRYANGEELRLELVKPASLQWTPNLQLNDLELRGPRGSVRAALISNATTNAEIRAQQISSEWFRPVFLFPTTDWVVDSFEADARWTDGPAVFSVRAGVTVHLGKDRAAQFATEMKGSAEGVDIAVVACG